MTSNIFFSFLIFFTYSIIIFKAVYRKSEFLQFIFPQPNFQEKIISATILQAKEIP